MLCSSWDSSIINAGSLSMPANDVSLELRAIDSIIIISVARRYMSMPFCRFCT